MRPLVSRFVAGLALGALSWSCAALVSGTFEPYDSGVGLLVNQLLLAMPAALVTWRHRAAGAVALLAGAYLGMNAYAYGFGGSESKAWAALGAVVSLLLIVAPMVLVLATAALRRIARP